MKTIQVTEEQYDLLKDLQQELKSQGNKGSVAPLFFVMECHGHLAPTGCGDEPKWHDETTGRSYNKSELFDVLFEDDPSFLIEHYNNFNPSLDLGCESWRAILKDWFNAPSTNLNFLGDVQGLTPFDISYHRMIANKGAFSFFEKDIDEHLIDNGNHYFNEETPQKYTSFIDKVTRMQALRELLLKLEVE